MILTIFGCSVPCLSYWEKPVAVHCVRREVLTLGCPGCDVEFGQERKRHVPFSEASVNFRRSILRHIPGGSAAGNCCIGRTAGFGRWISVAQTQVGEPKIGKHAQ
jgi:hypothetical protein